MEIARFLGVLNDPIFKKTRFQNIELIFLRRNDFFLLSVAVDIKNCEYECCISSAKALKRMD